MANVEKISVALTPELALAVREAVTGGEYASASEVIRDALRGWKQARAAKASTIDDLRRLWQEGLDSGLEEENGKPLDIEEIKRRGRARLAHRPAKAG